MDLVNSIKEIKNNTKVMTSTNLITGEVVTYFICKLGGEVRDVISNVYLKR